MNIGKRDLAWSYLARFLTIGANVILLPLIMRFLSGDELGLWYVFASISQIVNLFDFGFNSTISRHMTYAWSGASKLEKVYMAQSCGKEKNTRLMSEIIYTCRIVYALISVFAILIMMTAGTLYINGVVEGGLTKQIFLSWAIYAVAVFLNLFYGYWTSLLQGIGAVAERNKMGVFSKFFQIIIAAGLLSMGMGLAGFVIAYALSGISLRIMGRYFFKRKVDGLHIDSNVSPSRVKECFSAVWESAWRNGIVMLAEYFTTQVNTLICAYFIDLESVSVYGVVTQITSTIASVSTAYFNAYQPQYSSACLQRNVDLQKKLTCVSDLVYKIIFGSGMLAFLILGLPILHVIRPGMKIGIPFSLLMGLFYYLYTQQSLFVSMIASSNRILCCRSYIITAAFSFFITIILVKEFGLGIWGLVIGQVAANLAYNNWKWPVFVLRETGIRYKDIYTTGAEGIKNALKQEFS